MTHNTVRLILFTCLLLSTLSNCVSTPNHSPLPSGNQTAANKRWAQWYEQWHGTPYRFGGSTLSGVDCSALVQDAYRYVYQLNLPRTTTEQRRIGHAVNTNGLAVGDLLFFKPDRNNNHVGIYLGNQRFVHASSSKGVTISPLNDVYWLPRLTQARRILK